MRLCFYWMFIFFMLAGFLGGQEKSEKEEIIVHRIVVTATRAETDEQELASSVTVVTAGELQKAGKKTVAEALADIPGLDVSLSGGFGKSTSVFIRGANSEHTLVLIDGVEVNDAMSTGRSFDFAHLSLDSVERIEIVRGPQGPVYGSDAMAGVIHIITRKGQAGKKGVSFNAEGGSYGTYREMVEVKGGSTKLDYAVGVSFVDSQGYSSSHVKYGNIERDGYRQASVNGRLGIKLAGNAGLSFINRVIHADSDLDNGGGENMDDPNYVELFDHWLSILKADWLLARGRWQQTLTLSRNLIKREYDNDTDPSHPVDSNHGFFTGKSLKADWQHRVDISSQSRLIAGFEWEREAGESEYFYESIWGKGQDLFPVRKVDNIGFYFQGNTSVGDRLFINGGVRLDRHRQFGRRWTYRLAPALLIGRGIKIKATLGTGFKSPSLYQLYAPANLWGNVGNPALNPETSIGWDAGFEYASRQNRFSAGITYFHNRFNNLILFDWLLGFVNVSEAKTFGWEFWLSLSPVEPLIVKGTYTFTSTEDLSSHRPLWRRPRHKGSLSMGFRFLKGLNLSANLVYVGEREDVFPYPQIRLAPAYTLVNASINWEISPQLSVFLREENLFNIDYEEVLGYGTPRRSVYLGLGLNFN